ncbi:hypothetical protein [Silvimonas amylolytica]|uniref:Uncharacterized protein n=1 Tax=Silvimonas amylolytica TaxID=449663 RepID=A0ABQ2PKM2_9NEIS|nr:hypothetical protein [Silvimonas amylolytica]GGP25785.1 hypothetical protein GCM10010971_16040 [Silvimonas amylolytica]
MSDELTPRAKAVPAFVVGAGFAGVAMWDWLNRHSCTDTSNGACAYFTRLGNAWMGEGYAWQLWAMGEALIGLLCVAYGLAQWRKQP